VALNVEVVSVDQFHGWQAHHERVFQALGLVPLIDDDDAIHKNDLAMLKGP
jgi:hypothetical protein